ncbi:MAG: diguanylate cyclase [Gammaproteobacteria bacterium]|nr:diguanylate cyclase [Gammaproteobacteria bacterium]MCP5407101.1 diguanylate cyclase [Chromatiaceae bacterium]MCP5408840.1 diguanylate cyclase [Chromatiaceae bacterium]MCP5445053.1 diguanylate cyclase [Chromatiaceae bacterium]
MKILLVDDTHTMRMLMTAILEDFGHNVICCENGEEAVENYLREHPDLILMDVVMPVMDGYQAAIKIRAIDNDWVPIIFLSTRADPRDVAAGIEAGGDDYLIKPVDETVLKAKLIAMQRIATMRHKLIGLSKDLEKANSVLQRQAEVDGLTGLANRRLLDRHLGMEIARCTRTLSPLSVIMADLDHFKTYNDHYGHLAGDACLKKVADALKSAISRSNDLACRYGGEEFCIVLPDTDKAGVVHVAEQLRLTIEKLGIPHITNGGCVSMSLGTSTTVPDKNCTAEQLIEGADQALYQAKLAGRNRVFSSASPCGA